MNQRLKVAMLMSSYSGSNTLALYRNMPDYIRDKYEVVLHELNHAHQHPDFYHSDVYINTHGEYPSNPGKLNVELWHGFPIKGMAFMDREEKTDPAEIFGYWSDINIIASYSPLYNTLMNACNGARIEQYQITGMPRNDLLFNDNSTQRLTKMIPELAGKKILFFMPTFRKSVVTPEKIDGRKTESNLFGFEHFDQAAFAHFLQENNLALVVKLHPFEEAYFLDSFADWNAQNIYFLTNEMLIAEQADLYELLGAADLLMTDYSSVYFDYMLLDRPLLFTPVDLEQYRETRGFLLEPYEYWTPGPKALDQQQLTDAISVYLHDPTAYREQRQQLLPLIHTYTDNRSAMRVWETIDRYIVEHAHQIAQQQQHTTENRQLQEQIKQSIYTMIEQGKVMDAERSLQEYLQTAKADADVFSMKAMIHLLAGQLQDAIDTLNKGSEFFPGNADLIYNLAYMYENASDWQNASLHYQKFILMSDNEDLKQAAQQKIQLLKQEGAWE
ncbi:CDP-glycerol glycerophosphotransferase family protein [Paenibacillus sp. WLX1005]|uniref:CDP-glycerol glycerophosphotransferase family protein n=1 Tax=Paenibacillus sp. WLX1005 TaxID=3243766 RepID=UPI0039842F67